MPKHLPAVQADSHVELDDEPCKVAFTISFNPYPARVKPKKPAPKALPAPKKKIKR